MVVVVVVVSWSRIIDFSICGVFASRFWVVVVVSWSRFIDFSIFGVFASRFWVVVVLVVAVGLERLGGLKNRGKSLSTKTS